jgi:hypothetical protein
MLGARRHIGREGKGATHVVCGWIPTRAQIHHGLLAAGEWPSQLTLSRNTVFLVVSMQRACYLNAMVCLPLIQARVCVQYYSVCLQHTTDSHVQQVAASVSHCVTLCHTVSHCVSHTDAGNRDGLSLLLLAIAIRLC